jgi:FkbM family methyltransferase
MKEFIIEVGSNSGTDTVTLASNNPECQVIAIEPTPELLSGFLYKLPKQVPNIKVFPFAIDLDEGIKNFNIAGYSNWGRSSLHEFTDNIHEQWEGRPDFKFTHSVDVLCIRGDKLCDMLGVKSIKYLWVDTQGNDFRTLKSFGKYLEITKAGKCEAAYSVHLYKDVDNSYLNIVKFLENLGFKTKIKPDVVHKECDVHFWRE